MAFFSDDDGDPGTLSLWDSPTDRFAYGGLLALRAANTADQAAERRNQQQLEKLEQIAKTEADRADLETQRLELEKERLALEKAHRENEKRIQDALVNLKRAIVEIKLALKKVRSDLQESSCDLFSPTAGSFAFIGTQIEDLQKVKGQLVDIVDIEAAEDLIYAYEETLAFFSSNSEPRRDPLDFGREVCRNIASIEEGFERITSLTDKFSIKGAIYPGVEEEFSQFDPETVPNLANKIADLIKENSLGLPHASGWLIKLYLAEHGRPFPEWATGNSETITANIRSILAGSIDKLTQARLTAHKRWTDEIQATKEREIVKEDHRKRAIKQLRKAEAIFEHAHSNVSLKSYRKARYIYKDAEELVYAKMLHIGGDKESEKLFNRWRNVVTRAKERAEARLRLAAVVIGGVAVIVIAVSLCAHEWRDSRKEEEQLKKNKHEYERRLDEWQRKEAEAQRKEVEQHKEAEAQRKEVEQRKEAEA
jgi:hypothetical protein